MLDAMKKLFCLLILILVITALNGQVLQARAIGQPAVKEQGALQNFLDCRNRSLNNTDDLTALAQEAQASGIRVLLLGRSNASRRNVSFLQERFFQVWVEEEGPESPLEPYYSIFSGADGILTDRPQMVQNTIGEITNWSKDSTLLFRGPSVIGYGGLPSVAPENSLEGLNMAIEQGVHMVEAGVFLTKDKVPMVSHQENLFALTGKNENISDLTETQATGLRIIAGNVLQKPRCFVTRFKDFLSAIRGTDTVLYAALSSCDQELVSQCRQLVSDLELTSQVIFIYPSESQKEISLPKSYAGIEETASAILAGEKLIFTENAIDYANMVYEIVPKSYSLQINTEAVLSTQAEAALRTAAGTAVTDKVSIRLLSNEEILKLSPDRTELSGVKYGTAVAVYEYTGTPPGSEQTYTLYSQPFTVSINSNIQERIIFWGAIALGIILFVIVIILIVKHPRGPKFKPIPMSKE